MIGGVAAIVALSASVPTIAAFQAQIQATVTVSSATVGVTVDDTSTLPTTWKPGDVGTTTLVVHNTGSIPLTIDIDLTGEKTIDSLGNVIDTVISGPGITNPAQGVGEAADLSVTNAGPLDPGDSATFTLTFTLPASVDNTWQGKTDQLSVIVTGTQEFVPGHTTTTTGSTSSN